MSWGRSRIIWSKLDSMSAKVILSAAKPLAANSRIPLKRKATEIGALAIAEIAG